VADPAALCGEPEGRYTLLHDRSDRTSVHHRHIPGTIAYYRDRLGFECLGTWQDPPVYAIVGRNRQARRISLCRRYRCALCRWKFLASAALPAIMNSKMRRSERLNLDVTLSASPILTRQREVLSA